MKKTKLDKQLEKILFEVYDKGVKHEDCNLTASIENVKQALHTHYVSGSLVITEADLVSFGSYLLSDERNHYVKDKKTVHHADLANWGDTVKNIGNQ